MMIKKRRGVREKEMKKKHKEYMNFLYAKADQYKSHCHFWKTAATVLIVLNSFMLGFWLAKVIFR